MTTTTRPATSPVLVPSATTQGVTYRVSESGCECEGYRFRQHCRHHDGFMADLKAMRNAYRCQECHTDPALPGRAFCAGCASFLLLMAEEAKPAPVATDWPARCHCLACGEWMAFTDDAPLYGPCCQRKAA